MPPRDPPRPVELPRGARQKTPAREDPRVEPWRPPHEPQPTPMGVKTVSWSALEVRVEHLEKEAEDVSGKLDAKASAEDLEALDRRVEAIESKRASVVTISTYPKVAKQHTDTTSMDKLLERRKIWAAIGRGVVQGLTIIAIAGLGGIVWSWCTSPKPQAPALQYEKDGTPIPR